MNPRRKKRAGMLVALLVGAGLTIGLIIYALNQNMDLFYTPTEVIYGKADGSKPEVGQRIRVGGMVVVGTVQRDSKSLNVSFDLADVGPSITITYDKILPDLFREGQGIVAQGILVSETTLEAFEVLAKHDEEYMPPEVAEAMEKTHEPLGYSKEQLQGSAE